MENMGWINLVGDWNKLWNVLKEVMKIWDSIKYGELI
jgi:hypothetical protein